MCLGKCPFCLNGSFVGKYEEVGSFVVNVLVNWSNFDGVLILFADLGSPVSIQVMRPMCCFFRFCGV